MSSSADRQGKLILAACAVFLVALMAFAGYQQHLTSMRNPDDLCLKDKPPAERVVILVDKTDALNADQARQLTAEIRHLKETGLAKDGKLSIFLVGDFESGYLRRVFCMCNPGAETNALWGNPKRIRARFDRQFGAPLDSVMEQVVAAEVSERSPLLEAVKEVAGLDEFAPGPPRRLIIVSDFLQSTDSFSCYTAKHSFASLKASPAYAALRADLAGASVTMVSIQRKRDLKYSDAGLIQLWEEYFKDCGAALTPRKHIG